MIERTEKMTRKKKPDAPQSFADEVAKVDSERTAGQNQVIEQDEQQAAARKSSRVDRIHSLSR
jgi:hypothetical protein